MNTFCLIFAFSTAIAEVIGAPVDYSNVCVGAFQTPQKGIAVISKFDPGDGNFALFFLDFQSGYARILQEKDGRLFGGSSLVSASPIELSVTCDSTKAEWQISGRKFTGRRVGIEKQEAYFGSGNIRLAGTLFLPPGRPPFPALILLHGSGKLTRYSFGPIPYFFCANGYAVLTYDKRGAGASGGDFQDATFQDFIADGIAAFSYLRSRKEIDPARIGLWGSSQGGFISAGIAAKLPDVRLLIDQSGMFVPAWQQEIYRVSSEMEARGYNSREIDLATSYLNRLFQAGKTGSQKDWQQTLELSHTLKGKDWLEVLPHVDSLQEIVSFWKNDYSYDPTDMLAQVRCPVRAVFGSLDRSTPVQATIRNMSKALKGKDFEYVIIRNANHSLLEAGTGSEQEIPGLKRFVPRAFEIQTKWLSRLTADSPQTAARKR